jgi:hypothetical protein
MAIGPVQLIVLGFEQGDPEDGNVRITQSCAAHLATHRTARFTTPLLDLAHPEAMALARAG